MALIDNEKSDIKIDYNEYKDRYKLIKSKILNINDQYSIYPILKYANEIAQEVGLTNFQCKELEVAIRELVSNVVRHGGGSGQVRFFINQNKPNELIIEVEDWGSGIANFDEVIEDGYSTKGGLGGGLPAVNRMMDSFQLVSRPNSGTLFRTSKLAKKEDTQKGDTWRFSVYTKPKESETENGDGFLIKRQGNKTYVFLIDGLGHGSSAHLATQKALKYLEDIFHWDVDRIIDFLNKKLTHTRGIVMGIAIVFDDKDEVRYTGIGNIYGRIIGKNNLTFLNYNGTIGGTIHTFKTLKYDYSSGDIMVLHSDGISGNWIKDIDKLWHGNLQEFNQSLFQRYSRSSDDATVIAGIRR